LQECVTKIVPLIDKIVNLNETVRLKTIVTDSFDGTIVKYEWQIGASPYSLASGADTTFNASSTPIDSLRCILKVTDDEGNVSSDTAYITVVTRIPSGMRFIRGSSFIMGDSAGYSDERPTHQVTLSSFFIDTIEVTQKQYRSLLNVNPSFAGDIPCKWCILV
jgi:hypothetical protein